MTHPAALEACVVGVPDEWWAERALRYQAILHITAINGWL